MRYYHPIVLIFGVLITITIRCNIISEATLVSSPKNVSMSLQSILNLRSFETNLRIILSKLLLTVLTLNKSYCSSVIPFQSLAFKDVVILVGR